MFKSFLQRFCPKSKTNVMTQAIKEFVDSRLKKHAVVVFSKTHCPYCRTAKDAMNSFQTRFRHEAYECVDIDGREDMDGIQDYLKELTGARSVPRVFIGAKFFGGGDDTATAWKTGDLEKKLEEAGAFAK